MSESKINPVIAPNKTASAVPFTIGVLDADITAINGTDIADKVNGDMAS